MNLDLQKREDLLKFIAIVAITSFSWQLGKSATSLLTGTGCTILALPKAVKNSMKAKLISYLQDEETTLKKEESKKTQNLSQN